MQLLNVLHEGTLYQDLPSEHLTHINHLQTHDRNLPQHTVTIEPNTLLGQFSIESKNVNVNSSHHQAIKKVGKKLIINAKAPDHVIEGIESTHHKYCLGIQWHPEFHVNSLDKAIFESFYQSLPSLKSCYKRISKFLSHAGVCSRRQAEQLISEGQIKVDGQVL